MLLGGLFSLAAGFASAAAPVAPAAPTTAAAAAAAAAASTGSTSTTSSTSSPGGAGTGRALSAVPGMVVADLSNGAGMVNVKKQRDSLSKLAQARMALHVAGRLGHSHMQVTPYLGPYLAPI